MGALSRRDVLAALLASVPAAALAGAPGTALRPRPRPDGLGARPAAADGSAAIIAGSGLGEMTGFALADAATGQVVQAHRGDELLPPASVCKVFTTLYALDALGPDFVFETRVLATGPVEGGRVQGDLVLVGSGDPHLDSDHLAEMVKTLRDKGIRGVDGRFLVVGSALPPLHEIDPGQPDFVGYNPAVSGLNLNFNRVYFEWSYPEGALKLSLQARADGHSPEVRSVHIETAEREAPVFAWRSEKGADFWTVAAPALRQPGGRWLPVRNPETYAAEVFRALGQQYGVDIPQGSVTPDAPQGQVVASWRSIPLRKLARSMLLFSTNLTAEVLGLTASQKRGLAVRRLADSGAAMTDWARQHLGLDQGRFVNHSGLSDQCLVSAGEMVRALVTPGSYEALNGLMKKLGVEGSEAVIQAKTGTLNFCKGLAGYIDRADGKRLAFAIFSTDAAKRAAFSGSEDEQVPGARTFSGRARGLEQALLAEWAG